MSQPQTIQAIITDVDGVLTDGGLFYDDHGNESKRFHVRDGFAMKAAMRAGIKVAVLTGRTSGVVHHRMTELGVDALVQGSGDKGKDFDDICRELGVAPEHACYIGDDLIDLPAMRRSGYGIAVADADPELLSRADWVTTRDGGNGAVREAVEHIMGARGLWDQVVATYAEG